LTLSLWPNPDKLKNNHNAFIAVVPLNRDAGKSCSHKPKMNPWVSAIGKKFYELQ
jgi:hypothetical protein